MAIKTFNIDEKTYKEYLELCKKEGISMSKKIDNFIRSELESLKKKHKPTVHAHITTNPQSSTENSFSKYCY
jgi:hypothetical protein